MKISVFVVVKPCVCSQLMWWTIPEGNWLLTSAKNHLESSWLQVIEKWFTALIVTAYSFMFEQMNSESSHHRRNGTWRWTLIIGFDLHGGAWDLLRQTHTLINTETFSTKHTAVVLQTLTVPVRRSEKTMVQSLSVLVPSTNKMITYTDVCGCESIVCVIQWAWWFIYQHRKLRISIRFILAQREMMTQVDAVYYQFKRKHHRL